MFLWPCSLEYLSEVLIPMNYVKCSVNWMGKTRSTDPAKVRANGSRKNNGLPQ